jgi:hypothetical protein
VTGPSQSWLGIDMTDEVALKEIAFDRRMPRTSVGYLPSRKLIRATALICLYASISTIGGCGGAGKLGSFDSPETSGSKLAKLLGLSKEEAGSSKDSPGRRVFCPDIMILEGTEVARFYAGSPPSNSNLRYQYSIEDMARECSVRDDQLVLKIGIEGKVLLGPNGSSGNFSVPVRIAILRRGDQSPIASKLYRAATTIAAKQSEESFTIISEPISVPFISDHAEENYTIKVGIDSAAGSEPDESRGRKR